ncbi:MAG: glycosyltransferase [Ktedonobacteraceae bacterium]|nr:glycosyltransferase [Ktedonobacteraceae bacterium]
MFWVWGIYVLTFLWLIHDACLLNWHILSSWRWSIERHDDASLCLKKAPEVIILLPVLREQRQLQTTLQALEDLPYPGRKRIIVVTTEREIAENNGELGGTTVEITKHILASRQQQPSSLYEHIHYPWVRGNKASQLNYAFREMTKNQEDLSACYIGIYDADSHPAPDTLLRLFELIAREEERGHSWPIAIQQPALFFGNFQRVSWYLQLEALFQTRWVFGHEIRTLRASARSSCLVPYAYCVGHGMFIRADFLARTGGFPEPSEDVPLGHRLTFLALPIHPLPVYDVCDVAPRVSALIRQSGFWFCNAPLIWREYARLRTFHVSPRKTRSAILLLKGLLDIFSWVHYPLHLLALSFLLLHGTSFLYALLSLLMCYLDAGVGIVLMLSLFPACSSLACGRVVSLRFGRKAWLVLCSPLRNIVRGVAPFLACWYLIQSLVLKRMNILPKTTR